jgi:hypothetical protein
MSIDADTERVRAKVRQLAPEQQRALVRHIIDIMAQGHAEVEAFLVRLMAEYGEESGTITAYLRNQQCLGMDIMALYKNTCGHDMHKFVQVVTAREKERVSKCG